MLTLLIIALAPFQSPVGTLEGSWQVTRLVEAGEEASKARTKASILEIKGDKFVFRVAGDVVEEGRFKKITRDGRTCLEVTSGTEKHWVFYKLVNDRLIFCTGNGTNPPETLESKRGTESTLAELSRIGR
jgi:uncharacterized protein (TIGR03067 family)